MSHLDPDYDPTDLEQGQFERGWHASRKWDLAHREPREEES